MTKDSSIVAFLSVVVAALVVAHAGVAAVACSGTPRRVVDVAPDACDLLAPEVPAEVCKKAHDAHDLLDKILSGRRAGAAASASARKP